METWSKDQTHISCIGKWILYLLSHQGSPWDCLCVCVCVCVLVAQSCLTLCDPMGGSLLGSSVYGILQAKILGWVVIPFSRGSSVPKHPTRVSYIAGRFFTIWATVFKLACGVCLSTGLVKMRYIWMWKFCVEVKCKTSIEFFFTLIFILYWSTVDLQCCVSFRHTAKWLSFTYIYICTLFQILFSYRRLQSTE